MHIILIYLLISFFAIEINSLSGDEWPDWRGPSRDGTWNEKGIMKRFDFKEFKIKWSAPVSTGYSGPTIQDGRDI